MLALLDVDVVIVAVLDGLPTDPSRVLSSVQGRGSGERLPMTTA
jgi:hypothetical protein